MINEVSPLQKRKNDEDADEGEVSGTTKEEEGRADGVMKEVIEAAASSSPKASYQPPAAWKLEQKEQERLKVDSATSELRNQILKCTKTSSRLSTCK